MNREQLEQENRDLKALLRKNNICPKCERSLEHDDSIFGGYWNNDDLCNCRDDQ